MVRSHAPRRDRRRRDALRTYHRWAVASLVGLIIIVPSGGLVRLTKSGLGCPDWPGCNGGIVPELSAHTMIEYSNRVLSFIVMVVAAITWWLARRVADGPHRLSRWSGAAALASAAQGPLGGLTVLLKLHPLMVGAHFLLSMIALAPAVVAVLLARDRLRGTTRTRSPRRATAAGCLLALLGGVICTGIVVTSSGPHSGDKDVTRRFWDLDLAAMIHVRTVIAFVIVGVGVWIWLARSGGVDPLVRRLALIFAPLLTAQVIIGEYQYRNGMHWQVIAVHVTVAALLLAVGTATAWRIGHPPANAALVTDDPHVRPEALQATGAVKV